MYENRQLSWGTSRRQWAFARRSRPLWQHEEAYGAVHALAVVGLTFSRAWAADGTVKISRVAVAQARRRALGSTQQPTPVWRAVVESVSSGGGGSARRVGPRDPGTNHAQNSFLFGF